MFKGLGVESMKVLDLFSGIGGFSLGLERAGMETVAFCEIEKYPQRVLAKHWPNIPIYEDVRELTYDRLKSDGISGIDVICGGFPCQDISVAGKQAGIGEGTRSGLWSECARLVGEIRPRYAIFENVTALLSGEQGRWFQRVLFDLSEVGYDAEWHCIPASELGANHHRDRVWIIAYPNMQRREGSLKEAVLWESRLSLQLVRAFKRWPKRSDIPSPRLSGKNDGIPDRAHRVKALGNAVVPQIPELIGRSIMAVENA